MTEEAPAAITITDHPDQLRYEVHVDDQLAGFAQYRLRPDRVVFTHTEIATRSRARDWAARWPRVHWTTFALAA